MKTSLYIVLLTFSVVHGAAHPRQFLHPIPDSLDSLKPSKVSQGSSKKPCNHTKVASVTESGSKSEDGEALDPESIVYGDLFKEKIDQPSGTDDIDRSDFDRKPGPGNNKTTKDNYKKSLLPDGYDPTVYCKISSTNNERYLYCPSLDYVDKQFCCGEIENRYCCSIQEWRASIKNQTQGKEAEKAQEDGWIKENVEGDVLTEDIAREDGLIEVMDKDDNLISDEKTSEDDLEVERIIEEDDVEDSLPGWAIALIVIGGLLIGGIAVYLIVCCFWKLLCCTVNTICCCCCCQPEQPDEERVVLVQDHLHHHQHQHQHPQQYGGTVTVVRTPAPLYTNVTQPEYTQQKLYPALN